MTTWVLNKTQAMLSKFLQKRKTHHFPVLTNGKIIPGCKSYFESKWIFHDQFQLKPQQKILVYKQGIFFFNKKYNPLKRTRRQNDLNLSG